MLHEIKLYDCDGCYKGPFLGKDLVYEYGLLLCPKCNRMASRRTFKERIREWLEILKELVK